MSSLAISSSTSVQAPLCTPQKSTQKTPCCSKTTLAKVLAVAGAAIITLAAVALIFTTPFVAISIGIAGGVVLTASLLALKFLPSIKIKINKLQPPTSNHTSETSTPNKTAEVPATTSTPISKRSIAPHIDRTPPGLKPLSALLKDYNACWNGKDFDQTKDILKFETIKKRLDKTLGMYNKQFSAKFNPKTEFGIVEKRDVPKSKIFVRADLHGDLKSLLENMKELQSAGLLNEHLQCAPDAQLVFLGDYMDRGDYSLHIAEFLACLKMENPDQVHLIRGNHEYININKEFGGKTLEDYIKDKKSTRALTKFYETMPLCVLIAQKQEGSKEYIPFVHASIEPSTDLHDLLDTNDSYNMMKIPRTRTLSERVKKLATPIPSDLNPMLQLGFPRDQAEKLEAEIEKLKSSNDPTQNERLKKLQTECAANRIRYLAEAYGKDPEHTAFNWGDIEKVTTNTPAIKRRAKVWALSPKDLNYWLLVNSTQHKVGLIFRGHEHELQHWTHAGKVLATTLPVGMDSPFIRKYPKQSDRAYILETAPALSDWQKQALVRKHAESTTLLTEQYPIESEAI
jgi:hypothetical protein